MRKLGLVLFATLSLIVHVTAAAILMPNEGVIKEERGAGAAALDVGSLFDSASSEAAEPEEVEQVEPEMEETQPAEVRQVIPVKKFTEQAVERQEIAAISPVQAATPVLKELTANEKLVKPDILKPRVIKPVEVNKPRPVKREKVVKPKPIKKKIVKKPVKKKVARKKKTTRKKVAKATSKKKSAASRHGGAKASKTGGRGGAGGKSNKARGKALTSNYKGNVIARIRRKAYYPSSLRGSGTRGTPRVSFSVSSSGRASNIRLSRSSGNRKLDQAALKAVRRASPFGKFPQGTGPSSMSFNIGISMRGR